MPILKDDVQILRVREQSNSSQIVVALGRRLGQFHVMAKGSRRWPKKGFEGGFDLLARGELLVYPRPDDQLWIFKEWDERARPPIGQSYRMLAAGCYFAELAEALTRHTAGSAHEDGVRADDSSEKLFDLLAASSDALAAQAAHAGSLVLGFTLKALDIEGILAPLEQCHICNTKFFERGSKPETVWISANGIECKPCIDIRRKSADPSRPTDLAERGLWLGPEAHRALLHIRRTVKPLKISATASEQLARSLAILVHGALERDLRTLSYAMKLVKSMTSP
ncbi:MAG: DNA repair protein RecO C-terminal domain-containing protein [Planctomycetota bacterium]